MVPEKLPSVIEYGIPTYKRIVRIFNIAVVLGCGGYVIYSIFDFSLANMAIALVILAAISGFAYSELSRVTAKLRLESDAFIFTNLFVEKRIPYSTVKGISHYFFAGNIVLEGSGIQLVPLVGKRISVPDQFNDYTLLKDWMYSNFADLKSRSNRNV